MFVRLKYFGLGPTRLAIAAVLVMSFYANHLAAQESTRTIPVERSVEDLMLKPPAARVESVTDTYHGVEVADPYRWLEDWSDEEVKAWSDKQNAYARVLLDDFPAVDELSTRVTKIMSAREESYGEVHYRAGRFFAIKRQPPKEQPFLITFEDLSQPAAGRVLLDPWVIDQAGTTSIDWYEPSPNGQLVAISLSEGGSEVGNVRVIDVETGSQLGAVVPRVNSGTAGGDLAWLPDNSGFYYTRHPYPGERPDEDLGFYQRVYLHKLGTDPGDDQYQMGEGLPRIAEIELEVHSDGSVLVTVQNGDGGQFAHYLKQPGESEWRQFSHFGDRTIQAAFLPDGDLIVMSRDEAPRGKLLRLSRSNLDIAAAKLVVPQSEDTIVNSFYHSPPSILATESRIFVIYQVGGPSELRVFAHDGSPQTAPQQLPVSSVDGLEPLEADNILFMNTSYLQPPAYYRFNGQTNETTKTAVASDSPVSFDDVEVVREFATSKDGTKIPVNIIKPKSTKLDGNNPLVLNGYGGYSISLEPRFSSSRKVLLEQGVVFCVANLRGGGEYGEEWHRQGNLTRKQNVFDDFYAAAQHLIERNYTRSDRLAILGGSNGGLLMGATLTQHPDLAKAVVAMVGIYDMLRVELSPNGSFNIPEFGTVTKPDQFAALRAYSPYHNVRDGVAYPAILFMTGANDPRVDPMQSRKMTARLQAATSSDAPILLRTTANAGHGGDTALSERIAQAVDMYGFLFEQLGVAYRPVR